MAEHILSVAGVSEQVRDFYNRYPYPPLVDDLEKYRRLWQNEQRRRADFHRFWPGLRYRENQSILVAGCGTSQAAKHALRWPMAQVIGIDCSETSVRHTEQLKKKYSLNNLEVRRFDLERAGELGISFDQIVCTGVLHHLEDPDAGLRALRSVLNPDGAMQLMVYAPYGRAGIYLLQDFFRRVGVRAADAPMQDVISVLKALPEGHPIQQLLAEAPELKQEAALADSLLHPNDRAYSVPQLFAMLKNAGLAFGRWLKQAPYSPHCGAVAGIPQAGRMARLPLEEQSAAVELFRGNMTRHSAIVYRDTAGASLQSVQFAGDDWLHYVPLREPDTISVEDGLPPGIAAVLINRTHAYRDLLLPLGPVEKQLVDRIDGQSTISGIMQQLPVPSSTDLHGRVREFFQRLWWYDQVVFATAP